MSEYPTSDELLACLYTLAGVAETEMQKPFRVDMIRTHGKPPMYSVVVRAAEREPILTFCEFISWSKTATALRAASSS